MLLTPATDHPQVSTVMDGQRGHLRTMDQAHRVLILVHPAAGTVVGAAVTDVTAHQYH